MNESQFELIECPDRETWLKERRKGIGASEAAAVLGASPWKTAIDLWAEKVGIAEQPEDESEWLKWGRRLEPVIRETYMEETGRMVIRPGGEWTLVRSKKYPWMVTTLDGEIVPVDDKDGPGVFESKTAMLFKKDEWADEPPLQYQIQNQHQLVVTGWLWGGDAVLLGGSRFLHQDFEVNQDFQYLLIEKLEAFWSLVQSETPPAIDGSDSAKELLRRLYPKQEPNKVIELPLEAVDWHRDLVAVKEELKLLEGKASELKNQFAAVLKDAEIGVLPSGDSYTYKFVEKKAAKSVQVGDLIAAYRELRFKAKKERR